MSEPPQDAPPASEPILRVVTGDPTAEELAALVAVLAARTTPTGGADEPPTHPTAWSAPSRLMRTALRPGPDAWRRSAFRS